MLLLAPYRDRVASTTMSTPVRRNRFWHCWESPGSPLCRPPLTPRSSRRRQLFAGGDADNASLPASAVFNPASDIDLLHSVQTRFDTLGKFSGYLGARKLETSPLTDEPNVDGTVWLEICPRKAEVYRAITIWKTSSASKEANCDSIELMSLFVRLLFTRCPAMATRITCAYLRRGQNNVRIVPS